jgi:hypothetical protein
MEGFASIRSMRSAFFTRAVILYETDWVSDDLTNIQICLLLSFQRSYLNSFYDNERWILAAYQRLKQTGTFDNIKLSAPEFLPWKIVYSCWLMRAIGLVIGLKSTSQPEILNTPPISISTSELDSSNFSWFLDGETKKYLSRFFIARISLTCRMVRLCRLILDRGGGTGSLLNHRAVSTEHPSRSVLGEIEDSDIDLSIWRSEQDGALTNLPPPSMSITDKSAYILHQSLLKLTYE